MFVEVCKIYLLTAYQFTYFGGGFFCLFLEHKLQIVFNVGLFLNVFLSVAWKKITPLIQII